MLIVIYAVGAVSIESIAVKTRDRGDPLGMYVAGRKVWVIRVDRKYHSSLSAIHFTVTVRLDSFIRLDLHN